MRIAYSGCLMKQIQEFNGLHNMKQKFKIYAIRAFGVSKEKVLYNLLVVSSTPEAIHHFNSQIQRLSSCELFQFLMLCNVAISDSLLTIFKCIFLSFLYVRFHLLLITLFIPVRSLLNGAKIKKTQMWNCTFLTSLLVRQH